MMKDLIPWRTKNQDVHPSSERQEHPVTQLHQRMNSLFDDFFDTFDRDFPMSRSLFGEGSMMVAPKFEVSESEASVDISAELPGMSEKDVEITLDNNTLVVKGEKKQEKQEKKKNYHLSERSYGSFQRAVALPDNLKTDQVKAKFKNGVLDIHIPKTEEARKRRKTIAITSE